jgi:hypothetical protein
MFWIDLKVMSDHGQGTGEYKLVVAILVTYIHDLRRHYLYWLNSFLMKTYKEPLRQEPFNMKILFSMAESHILVIFAIL